MFWRTRQRKLPRGEPGELSVHKEISRKEKGY